MSQPIASATGARRWLPADGRWQDTPQWRRAVERFVDPRAAEELTAALTSVFTAEWAAGRPESDRPTHDFEYWHATGQFPLVELGWALARIGGVPERIAKRLQAPGEYWSASTEVRTAALFRVLGAEIEWIEESGPGKSAEFWATIHGERTPVEVKQQDDGKVERRYSEIDLAWHEGLQRGCAEALRGRGDRGLKTHTLVDPPLGRLEALADEGPLGLDAARELGREGGRRVGTFLATDPPDGKHDLASDLRVEVHRIEGGSQHVWEPTRALVPSTGVSVTRAIRKLRRAAPQLAAAGEPGITVLEPRWPRYWPSGFSEGMRAVLARGDFPEVAALVLRQSPLVGTITPQGSEQITVLPGPRWGELSPHLRAAFPPRCRLCGMRHGILDLISWSPGDPVPWIQPVRGDESTFDAANRARATPPSMKLRQALDQMQLAFTLERANLRTRFPSASAEEIERAFRDRLLRDA